MNSTKKTTIGLLTMLASSFVLMACASTDATRVEEDFGNSVRHMVNAQIYDPEAAKNPPKDPPMGIDAIQAESVLEVYREHVGDPRKVSESLRIDISE